MAVSGMAAQLAHALASSGPLYLLAAPFVGALGGFVSLQHRGPMPCLLPLRQKLPVR